MASPERGQQNRPPEKGKSAHQMPSSVITWYLETTSPGELRPARISHPCPRIERVEIPSPELSRFLYTAVGGDWHWHDRLPWTHERWMQWLDRPELQTWVLYDHGTLAGYVELEKQAEENVEIAYFGLLKAFIGRGLGGHLLTEGIERAWAMNAKRVWVHTCSLDAPSALQNYQSRGMRIYDQKTETLPDLAP
jgi:GNAT superfamily N-acetyltransferase